MPHSTDKWRDPQAGVVSCDEALDRPIRLLGLHHPSVNDADADPQNSATPRHVRHSVQLSGHQCSTSIGLNDLDLQTLIGEEDGAGRLGIGGSLPPNGR